MNGIGTALRTSSVSLTQGGGDDNSDDYSDFSGSDTPSELLDEEDAHGNIHEVEAPRPTLACRRGTRETRSQCLDVSKTGGLSPCTVSDDSLPTPLSGASSPPPPTAVGSMTRLTHTIASGSRTLAAGAMGDHATCGG